MHVHMTCIDDVILDDESPDEALQHVPAERNAMVIFGFTKENNLSCRPCEYAIDMLNIPCVLQCILTRLFLGASGKSACQN